MTINLWIKVGIREQKKVIKKLGYTVKTIRRFCKEDLNLNSPDKLRILAKYNLLNRNICYKNESERQKIKLEVYGFFSRYSCDNRYRSPGFSYQEQKCKSCAQINKCYVGRKDFVNFPYEYCLELIFKNYINSKIVDEFLF